MNSRLLRIIRSASIIIIAFCQNQYSAATDVGSSSGLSTNFVEGMRSGIISGLEKIGTWTQANPVKADKYALALLAGGFLSYLEINRLINYKSKVVNDFRSQIQRTIYDTIHSPESFNQGNSNIVTTELRSSNLLPLEERILSQLRSEITNITLKAKIKMEKYSNNTFNVEVTLSSITQQKQTKQVQQFATFVCNLNNQKEIFSNEIISNSPKKRVEYEKFLKNTDFEKNIFSIGPIERPEVSLLQRTSTAIGSTASAAGRAASRAALWAPTALYRQYQKAREALGK